MELPDLDEVKYRLDQIARHYDPHIFVQTIEEHYDGEVYKIFFQRGSHSHILEVEGEQLLSWFSGEEEEPEDMVMAIRIAVEELGT